MHFDIQRCKAHLRLNLDVNMSRASGSVVG
jgi:hypothetical protein